MEPFGVTECWIFKGGSSRDGDKLLIGMGPYACCERENGGAKRPHKNL